MQKLTFRNINNFVVHLRKVNCYQFKHKSYYGVILFLNSLRYFVNIDEGPFIIHKLSKCPGMRKPSFHR